MMIETALGAFGVCFGVLLWWTWLTRAQITAQTAAIVAAVGAVENLQELAQEMQMNNPTEHVAEMLEDTFGNMHVPTGQDHIQAAIATGMNMLFMKFLGGGGDLGQMVGMLNQNVPESGNTDEINQ